MRKKEGSFISSYGKVYIYTLGQLFIRHGDKVLFSGNRKLNKRWKLFLLLLCRRGQTISDQQLISELNMAENATPRQSLRALVYRLRRDLAARHSSSSFIYTERGGYGFNPESDFWMDGRQFKNMIETGTKEESLEKLNYALRMYKGIFLKNQKLDNNKLLKKRKEYSELYLNAVNTTAELLKKNNGEYDKIIDLYETSLQLYPLNVNMYLELIKTLKEAGKLNRARVRAEEIMSFLRNSDIKVPMRLEELVSDFFKIDLAQKPEFMLNNNSINNKIFECGPVTFSNIYNLEKRRAERKNNEIFLIHFQLNNTGNPHKMREAESILRKTLHEHLRSSDVITRWEPRHYLLLAVGLSEKEIKIILQRIENKFRDRYFSQKINLTYKYQNI
ncbi:MAG: AfsR/SARP family transcriptional regulator [Bacillota bacterium]